MKLVASDLTLKLLRRIEFVASECIGFKSCVFSDLLLFLSVKLGVRYRYRVGTKEWSPFSTRMRGF